MTEQTLEQAREELRATLMDAIQKIDESGRHSENRRVHAAAAAAA